MDKITDRIVGDKDECTAGEAVSAGKRTGLRVGGTAFERSLRASPVAGTTRAFNLGPSYERPKNSSAPHAKGKMFHNEWDDHLELQKDIIKVLISTFYVVVFANVFVLNNRCISRRR